MSRSGIDRLDETPDAAMFFEKHISRRQPCIIRKTNNGNPNQAIKSWPSLSSLENLMGDCHVQVEKRLDDQQLFGQGRTAKFLTTMTFQDFLRQYNDQRSLYYLSTQQESEEMGYDKYSCLTQHLVQHNFIPATLNEVAPTLLLQSCHLWMGGSQGSCSGLHHDFHDNFYWVQAGRKRLYLYPPTSPIPVYGNIHTIHSINGLISYTTQPTCADGVPLALLSSHATKDEKEQESDHVDEDDDDDDEEEVVIGKGFDYESDGEDGTNIDFTRDDYEIVEDTDTTSNEKNEIEVDDAKQPAAPKPPDHFSPVNLDDPSLFDDYPMMRECQPLIVELKNGDMLYLPASWFHCVWSYADEDEFHIAVNYWYHPPDQLDAFETPYQSDYLTKISSHTAKRAA